MIQLWVCYLKVTSSSFFKTIYPKKSLALIVIHVTSRVLHVPMGLVEVCISTERCPGHPMLQKKKLPTSYIMVPISYLMVTIEWVSYPQKECGYYRMNQ